MTSLNPAWIGTVSALLGTGLGWLLQQVTPYFAERRERRRAIAALVADLGEVHFWINTIDFMFTNFELLKLLPPHERARAWAMVDQVMLPDTTELHKRYGDSVTTLSS